MDAEPGVVGIDRRRIWRLFAIFLVLILAAYLRVHAVFETRLASPLQGDSTVYVSAAYNLRHFGVFSKQPTWNDSKPVAPTPDAFVAPGYPAMLSTVMNTGPNGPFLLRVFLLQALLGCVTVALTYWFAARILPFTGAIAVATLVAISPHLIVLGTSLLTETLYSAVIAAFICALVQATARGTISWYAVAGTLLGCSALVRPTLQYLPLLLVPAIALLLPRRHWKGSLALLMVFLVMFVPWLLRNEVQTGSWSDPTQMTSALVEGSYPDFMYQARQETLGFPDRFDPETGKINTPTKAVEHIEARFKADPAQMLRWYLVGKPIHFYDWTLLEGSGDVFINTTAQSPYFVRPEFVFTHWLMKVLHWPLVCLSFIGILWSFVIALRGVSTGSAEIWMVLALTMVFVMLVHVIGFPLGRYSVPFRPLTYTFAVQVLALATARWTKHRT